MCTCSDEYIRAELAALRAAMEVLGLYRCDGCAQYRKDQDVPSILVQVVTSRTRSRTRFAIRSRRVCAACRPDFTTPDDPTAQAGDEFTRYD